jgi:hypothetical protein
MQASRSFAERLTIDLLGGGAFAGHARRARQVIGLN